MFPRNISACARLAWRRPLVRPGKRNTGLVAYPGSGVTGSRGRIVGTRKPVRQHEIDRLSFPLIRSRCPDQCGRQQSSNCGERLHLLWPTEVLLVL